MDETTAKRVTGYSNEYLAARRDALGTYDAVVDEFVTNVRTGGKQRERDETQQKYDDFRRKMEKVAKEAERLYPVDTAKAAQLFHDETNTRNF